MRKFNLDYLKQNPDAKLVFIDTNGESEAVKFAFVFDQLVIKTTVTKTDYILQVDPVYNDGSIINFNDGALIGKVFIDARYELWGITFDSVVGGKRRELYAETFNSRDDVNYCVKNRLDSDFNPRPVLLDSWDHFEEDTFLNQVSKPYIK